MGPNERGNMPVKRFVPNVVRTLFIAFLLFSRPSAWAATGGSISGTVTDQSGAVIPDVTVTALNLDTTVQHTTKTNAGGFYAFTFLPVGRLRLKFFGRALNLISEPAWSLTSIRSFVRT
jgi:hypothetical protein